MTDIPNGANDDDLDAEFERIVEGVGPELRAQAIARARTMLANHLDDTGGAMSETIAAIIAEEAGRDVRTIWRWRTQHLARSSSIITEEPVPPSTTTASFGMGTTDNDDDETDILGRILRDGPSAFEFDDLMISLMYLCNGSQSELRRILIADGYDMPSLPTMCRKWKQVPPFRRDGAKYGVRNRATKLLYIRHETDEPNMAWQFDEFPLDILVRTKHGTKPINPSALLLVDECSRFIVSAVLLPHSLRSPDVLAALGAGFEHRLDAGGNGVVIGGYPAQITFDNASQMTSDLVTDAMTQLPITVKMSPAYTPMAKGKVERLGRTIQGIAIATLPGRVTRATKLDGSHINAVSPSVLLAYEDFETAFFQAVHRYNYINQHSSIGTTPFEAYSSVVPKFLTDGELAGLMIPVGRDVGRRLVHPDGLHVKGYYAHACLGPVVDQYVEVRGWHHRRDRLAAFAGKTFLGMVPLANHLTADERRVIVGQRIDETRSVYHHAAAARAAMANISEAIELGQDASAVTAMGAVKGLTMVAPRRAATATATLPAAASMNVSSELVELTEDDELAEARMLDQWMLHGQVTPPPIRTTPAEPAVGAAGPVPVSAPVRSLPANPQPAKPRPPGNKAAKQPTATQRAKPVKPVTKKSRDVAKGTLDEEPF